MGLQQDCLLSTTLLGLFIDGLRRHLKTAAPAAGVQRLQMQLRELVYADDICLIAASLPGQLQALLDALLLTVLLCIWSKVS